MSASAGVTVAAPATITSVSVSCNPITVTVSQPSQCLATVTGTGNFDSSVIWSADNGTIDQIGNYTAPSSPTTATVKATSKQDSTKSGTATIAVQAPAVTSVSVSCNPTTVTVGQTSQCSATVQGTGNFNPAVSWSVNSASGGNAIVGTVSSSGLYTAPNSVPVPQTVAVQAASQADATKSATDSLTIWRTAPTGSWQRTGPPGGSITVLAEDSISPGTIYASAANFGGGGVWKSTDGGATWTTLVTSTRADRDQVCDIAVVSGGKDIYVCILHNLFVRSHDGGATWTQISTGTGLEFRAMAVDAQNPSIIYLSAPGAGIVKSSDGGTTWALLPSSPVQNKTTLSGILHNALQVDPKHGGTVYYGTDHGLFISTDAGVTWALAANGFAATDTDVRDLAVDPANSSRILAIAGVLLYLSTDGGNSWTQISGDGNPQHPCCASTERVVPDPFDSSTVYLYEFQGPHAVYKSTDGGHTFLPADNGMPSCPQTSCLLVGFLIGPTGTMLASRSTTNTLLATIGNDGVFRSQDAAQSWSFSSEGLSAWGGLDVAVDPSTPSTVYLMTNGQGLFKSTDSGVTWANLGQGNVVTLAVDPFDSTHLVAHLSGQGIGESHDGGGTWQVVNNLPPPPGGTTATIVGITFHPTQKDTIFVSTSGGGVGLLQSTDGGSTYIISNSGLTDTNATIPVAVNPKDPNMLFLDTATDGFFVSTDGGKSWSLKSSLVGMTMVSIDSGVDPPALYAGTGTKLYKSLDLGGTWTALSGNALLGVKSLGVAVDPSTPNSIFLVADNVNGACYAAWSPDGGATWKTLGLLGPGPGLTFRGRGVAIAPTKPQILFATSISNSILRLVVGP